MNLRKFLEKLHKALHRDTQEVEDILFKFGMIWFWFGLGVGIVLSFIYVGIFNVLR